MGMSADEFIAKRVEEAVTSHEPQGENVPELTASGSHDEDNPPPFESFMPMEHRDDVTTDTTDAQPRHARAEPWHRDEDA